MPQTSAIPKYLERYSEAGIHQTPEVLQTCRFDCALVIPVYRESPDFVHRLKHSLLTRHSCLLILVINQPDNLPDADTNNIQLWHTLLQLAQSDEANHNRHGDQVFIDLKMDDNQHSALLLVDRFTQGRAIPATQGVGLARKIGADIALSLIAKNIVQRPWIWSSDADAHLPEDYFSAIGVLQTSNVAACIYPFQHTTTHLASDPASVKPVDEKINVATQLYEHSLNYYVAGLRWAGSPYAFHTLGSTLAVHGEHYAQVRGFPKRAGAEDFYLLNKLAKTGAIDTLTSAAIDIESRPSDRVPFGTGPAVEKLLALPNLSEAQLFYHPDIFTELKIWLNALPQLFTGTLGELELKQTTRAVLLKMKAEAAIEHAKKQSSTTEGFCRQMNTWFDGFRTLKFIHLLRDQGLHNVTLEGAKTAIFFQATFSDDP